jgi:cytochrome c oxidase subunit III
MSSKPVHADAAAGRLQEHFADMDGQTHAARLGMWAFLASEILFFSGLFTIYTAERARFGHAFAEATRHADLLLGSANTVILLTSSLLVALAVFAIRQDRSRHASRLLLATAALGVLFLVLKGIEYAHHISEGILPGNYYRYDELPGPGAAMFFGLYYLMTGLHALHVLGGIVLMTWIARRTRNGDFGPAWHTPLELAGLYWHFVDIVWLFLWPLFYLVHG